MKKLLTITFLLGCFTLFSQTNAERVNQMIGRGMNLGNALDAPSEGAWGVTLQASYFKNIADAGFNSVRIPIRWSAHSSNTAPYTIDQSFLDRVIWAVDQAMANNLTAIINIHHFNEIFQDPAANHDKLVGLWAQIAPKFKDYPENIVFEILNEPNTNLTAELWNTYLADALKEIRKTNPTRVVFIGAAEWGGLAALSKLKFPEGEQENVILTVHYYEPFQFTHQGASWVNDANNWVGTTWDSTEVEVNEIKDHFNQIKAKAEELNVPVNIGEFGAINGADADSRARWTGHCTKMFEEMGFSWNYWAYTANFDAYNSSTGKLIAGMDSALVGGENPFVVPDIVEDPTEDPQDTTEQTTSILVAQNITCYFYGNTFIASNLGNSSGSVHIINLQGAVIYAGSFANATSISKYFDDLNTGIYAVTIQLDNGEIETRTIFKE